MAVWLVRAGKQGERQHFTLENNIAAPGRNEFPGILKADSPLKRFWALVLED